MWKAKRIAVVVPAFCEQRLLPKTLATMPQFVDRVIVVDDGSPDDTWTVARRWARREDRIEVLRLGFNQGVGAAIVAGYRRALQTPADVVAVMAADAQMDPADLKDVLRPVVDESADYSKGDRLSHPHCDRMPPLRRFGTRVLGWLTGLAAGHTGIRDSQCGYTAICAATLRRLPLDRLYPHYGYPNDMLLRLAEHDAGIAQPPVRPVYADEQSGLNVRAVVAPIAGILLRGFARRVRRGLQRRLA